MKTVAFIPLRGGSKSIPLKNIKPLASKPLCRWVIEAAAGCAEIDEVYVCTDDDRIAKVATALRHPKVIVVGRSAESASDEATTEFVMLEFAREREFDRIVLIQATSPLLDSADLSKALADLDRTGADSLLSVVPQKRFLWQRASDGAATPQNYSPQSRPRRQDFDPYYVENGAFYICERDALLRSGCRLSGRILLHEMDEGSYYELDEPSDWTVVEEILRKKRGEKRTAGDSFLGTLQISADEFRRLAKGIKLFLTDVDGVLTDAGMYYSESGEELKKFNTRDGKGIELLREAGLKTGILTAENTKIVERRAAKLKMDVLVQGAKNKAEELSQILAQTGLTADEIAYIGDDLGDLPALKVVGLSASPGDAVVEVRDRVDYICRKDGGAGAVREWAEEILRARAE